MFEYCQETDTLIIRFSNLDDVQGFTAKGNIIALQDGENNIAGYVIKDASMAQDLIKNILALAVNAYVC